MVGDHKFYWSWREKAPQIICELRDQLQTDGCPHFSTGNSIEMRTKLKWMREGVLDGDAQAAKMSIQQILDGCPPICSAEKVLNHVKNCPIMSTNAEQVFWMNDFITLKPLERNGDIAEMMRHLILDGPIVGSFIVRDDFKPKVNTINLCQGAPLKRGCKEKNQRHCNTIVGYGVDEDYNIFWEYMETVDPLYATFDGDGFGRITVKGFDKVFVPLVN